MSRLRIVSLSNHLLGPINLNVGAGECVCVSGPSGVGKTLLLRAIADLDAHTGRVFLGNAECAGVSGPEWRRRVGLLPAESQWWHARVGEHFDNVDDSLLEQLQFDRKILDRKVRRLSTGERQRLGLLRLLSQRPGALLLDEPTASLDPKNVRRVERLIMAYRKKHKAPVLWVSHDLRQIKRVCNRHLQLIDGTLKPGDT